MLSYFITPIAAVLIADYWIMGKGKAETWKPFPGVNWLGITSWLVGTVTIYMLKVPLPELVGIAVSMLVYVALCKTVKNPRYNPYM